MSLIQTLCAAVFIGAPAWAAAQDAPPAAPATPGPPAGELAISLPDLGGADVLPMLLRRADVQSAIRLTVHERDALADLLGPNKMPIKVSLTSHGGEDPANQKQQIQDQIAAQFRGVNDRIKGALRPEQYDRLVEISLQWTGPMALTNSETAGRLKISPEHRTEIAKIASDYTRQKNEIMLSLAQQQTSSSPDGSKQMTMVRLNTSELENPLSPAYKKLDALKKDADSRILRLLSPEESAAWRAAQGAPIAFRTGLPGTRF